MRIAKTPPEERPRGVESANDVLGALSVGKAHEQVATPHGHDDECVHHPTSIGVGIEHDAHASEVGLEFLARLAVRDAHRVSLALRATLFGTESL